MGSLAAAACIMMGGRGAGGSELQTAAECRSLLQQ
jgi:hypothetical protein